MKLLKSSALYPWTTLSQLFLIYQYLKLERRSFFQYFRPENISFFINWDRKIVHSFSVWDQKGFQLFSIWDRKDVYSFNICVKLMSSNRWQPMRLNCCILLMIRKKKFFKLLSSNFIHLVLNSLLTSFSLTFINSTRSEWSSSLLN